MLVVAPEALTLLANVCSHNCSFMLRREHNEMVAKILHDPEASENDKFVALTMLRNAELIKCRRTEAIINEEYGFLDRNRGKESFLEYFRSKMADDDNFRNWNTAYKHFEKYCCGSCTFDDLTLEYCQGFLTYLLSLTTQTKGKMMASTANNNLNKLKCVLRIAYEERRIKENIAPRLKHAKEASTRREFRDA